MQKKVVIIGAGPGGLASALLLSGAGFKSPFSSDSREAAVALQHSMGRHSVSIPDRPSSGVGLRLWAGRSLGVWFTRDLEVHDDHELVTHGPYAWMRHPLYVALLLVSSGLGLLFQTPLSALAGAVLVFLALAPRVRREERLLALHFGSPSLSEGSPGE